MPFALSRSCLLALIASALVAQEGFDPAFGARPLRRANRTSAAWPPTTSASCASSTSHPSRRRGTRDRRRTPPSTSPTALSDMMTRSDPLDRPV